MDKNAIFNYVEYAREELQKLIKQKAFEYGITDKVLKEELMSLMEDFYLKKN